MVNESSTEEQPQYTAILTEVDEGFIPWQNLDNLQ